LTAHSGKKNDWQHILEKNMIGSTFWEKKLITAHDGENMIASTFWEKARLAAYFGENI
jgi:hypothetical protein